MSDEYDLAKSKIFCDFCGSKPAVLIGHFEKHLAIPRKINVCQGCHLTIHNMPLMEQYLGGRIKIPRSALPLFQRLYANVVDAHGNLILSGERLFNARYEVVEDKDWKLIGLLDCVNNLMEKVRA